MRRIFLLFFLIAGFCIHDSNAQLMKKLKQKVVERAENVVVEKTAQKAADKTGDAMDKILNPNFGAMARPGGKKVDMSALPAAYHFQYRYAIKVTSEQGETKFDYYLHKTQPYMGIKMDMGGNMTMVLDEGNKVIFTSINGMKTASEMSVTDVTEAEDMAIYNDYKITELPNKTFLGHDCIGRKMENDEHQFVIYIAPNMETGLGAMFKNEQTNMPPATQKLAKEYENGLMMYMEMVDKKARKKKNATATMECVAFEPVSLTISTRD